METSILVIGDFHGKFPEKLERKIKKEKYDLIASTGDYCGNSEFLKLFFKYSYDSGIELWKYIGKEKYKELEKKIFISGVNIANKLDSFNKPVIGVKGNWDPTSFQDVGRKSSKDKYIKKFDGKIEKSKNIFIVDFKNKIYNKINFVGYPASTYPGFVDKKLLRKYIIHYGKKEALIRIKKINKDNKKYFHILKKKFEKNKLNIFISHNCPYNTRLDLIKHGPLKGKHYGSYLTSQIIKKLKPRIVLCGHMHENQGLQKIGKTLIINPGAVIDSKAAIVKVLEKGKIRVKFIR